MDGILWIIMDPYSGSIILDPYWIHSMDPVVCKNSTFSHQISPLRGLISSGFSPRRLSLLLMPFFLHGDLLVPSLVRLKGSSSSTEVAEVLSLGRRKKRYLGHPGASWGGVGIFGKKCWTNWCFSLLAKSFVAGTSYCINIK